MPRGGSPEASDEGSAQADMEQQHMTQVAVLDTGTYCRAWFIAAVVSFYSSPRSRCCACLGRCGRGQVVTRGTPPHMEGCRSAGRGHKADAQDLRVHSREQMHDVSTIRSARRSEEHTSELQSRGHLVCRLLL